MNYPLCITGPNQESERVRLLQSQYKNTTASAWHYLPANVRSMPAVGLRCSAYVSLNQSDPAPAARPSTRNSLSSAILKLQHDRLSRESQQAPALTSSGKSKIIIKTASSSSRSTLTLTPDYFTRKHSANVNELISLRFWNSQGFEMLSGSWVSECLADINISSWKHTQYSAHSLQIAW